MSPPADLELSIVMPCLNEAETVGTCVEKAMRMVRETGIAAEVIVADNGSTDGSIEIAERLGARVVHVAGKGYGSALMGGIGASRGRFAIMGDADDSYDFTSTPLFLEKLREGYDLVMGCRLPKGGGTIMPGAMPWKNRWLGNPVLSFLGQLFYRTPIRDFHCGLRAFSREAYERMELKTTGMEFASEMVLKATLHGMRVAEVPVTLHPDGRSRPPHLRPWRDGWRHLRFMLIYSPRWLFLIPGLILAGFGVFATAAIYWQPIYLGAAALDVGSMMISCMAAIIGVQLVAFACFTKVFAIAEGLLPYDPRFHRIFRRLTLEHGLIIGVLIGGAGASILFWSIWLWNCAGFGVLRYSENMRRVIAAATLVVIGLQIVFSSFFLSVLGLKTTTRRPPGL